MKKNDLITKLGGVHELALRLNVSKTTVCNWRHHGVPWKYRSAIALIAAEKNVTLVPDFLMFSGAA